MSRWWSPADSILAVEPADSSHRAGQAFFPASSPFAGRQPDHLGYFSQPQNDGGALPGHADSGHHRREEEKEDEISRLGSFIELGAVALPAREETKDRDTRQEQDVPTSWLQLTQVSGDGSFEEQPPEGEAQEPSEAGEGDMPWEPPADEGGEGDVGDNAEEFSTAAEAEPLEEDLGTGELPDGEPLDGEFPAGEPVAGESSAGEATGKAEATSPGSGRGSRGLPGRVAHVSRAGRIQGKSVYDAKVER